MLTHWRYIWASPHQRATEDVAHTYLFLSLSLRLARAACALDTHTEVTYNVVLTCAVESLRDRFTRRGQDISHLNIDEVL